MVIRQTHQYVALLYADGMDKLLLNLLDYIGSNYCLTAVAVILLYDYMLTIDQEIRYVWNSRLSVAKILFYLNRFTMLGFALMSINEVLPRTLPISCKFVPILWECFALLSTFTWAAFSALRVYATGDRSWTLAALTLTIGLVPFFTNVLGFARSSSSLFSVGSMSFCTTLSSISATDSVISNRSICILSTSIAKCVLIIIVLIITRVSAVVSDTIVIGVAWHRLRTTRRLRLLSPASSLSQLLLRDGSLYFIALLVLNIAQLGVLSGTRSFFDQMVYLVDALTLIIISQLLLDMHELLLSVDNSFSSENDPSEHTEDFQQTFSHLSTFIPFSTSIPMDTYYSSTASPDRLSQDEQSFNASEIGMINLDARDLETTDLY